MGTIGFPILNELFKEVGIDVARLKSFTTGGGKRFAGTLSEECRYDIGLEDRCGGRILLKPASSPRTQDLLGLRLETLFSSAT